MLAAQIMYFVILWLDKKKAHGSSNTFPKMSTKWFFGKIGVFCSLQAKIHLKDYY